jgi:hypothetical protein
MGSLLGRLEGRERAARERVELLQAEISRLSGELTAAQERLSRLTITRETVLEVLAGPDLPEDRVASPAAQEHGHADDQVAGDQVADDQVLDEVDLVRRALRGPVAAGERATGAGVVAVVMGPQAATAGTAAGGRGVPVWSRGVEVSVLPLAYRDILTALEAATGPLSAAQVCAHLGTGGEKRHVEGMRSKLKRLCARGWLAETEPGAFTLAR